MCTSHDLREPLRSILNFSKLVPVRYGDRLDAKRKDSVERVLRAAQRMEMSCDTIEGRTLVMDAFAQSAERIRQTKVLVQVAKKFPSVSRQ